MDGRSCLGLWGLGDSFKDNKVDANNEHFFAILDPYPHLNVPITSPILGALTFCITTLAWHMAHGYSNGETVSGSLSLSLSFYQSTYDSCNYTSLGFGHKAFPKLVTFRSIPRFLALGILTPSFF